MLHEARELARRTASVRRLPLQLVTRSREAVFTLHTLRLLTPPTPSTINSICRNMWNIECHSTGVTWPCSTDHGYANLIKGLRSRGFSRAVACFFCSRPGRSDRGHQSGDRVNVWAGRTASLASRPAVARNVTGRKMSRFGGYAYMAPATALL